jgi:hypothetical protein
MIIIENIDGEELIIDFDTKTITSQCNDLDKVLTTITNIWATDKDAIKHPFPFVFRNSGWKMNNEEYEIYSTYKMGRIN